MHCTLYPHPDFPCDAIDSIGVEVARAGLFSLRYVVKGDLARLKLGEVRAPARADELWKSTCFEAFLRAPECDWYLEFNFAPSRQWAAYCFDRYREGMRELAIAQPSIDVSASDDELALQVALDMKHSSFLPPSSSWRLGLSAVIEETNGRKSYWALRHPAGKPDFHNPDCFALELPPP